MSPKNDNHAIKNQPLWMVPAILGILMLSSGGMFYLIAQGIKTLSGV